jgi:hypothetical protein
MKISRYTLSVENVPVDFFADPDGLWKFDDLVEAAGFDPESPGICVGALIEPFQGHPVGCAVVTEMGRRRPFVAIVDCVSSIGHQHAVERRMGAAEHHERGAQLQAAQLQAAQGQAA